MYAIKRELQLNNKEVSQMRGMAGFKRLVYNLGLELLKESWTVPNRKMSDSKRIDTIKKVFTSVTMKKPENKWMKKYPSTIYQSAFVDLKNAVSRWRKGLGGFPKKKSKKKGDSVLEAQKIPPVLHPLVRVGVDLGVKCLATVSDGTSYTMPLTTKRAKTKLSKMQWRNRNKVLGNKKLKIKASNKAKKYYVNLSRQHLKVANIRQDVIQKMTTDISRRAYIIRIEDLNVAGMMANHKLAEAVSNNCFYEIRRQLIYKQTHYGTHVELVDRWYPSSKTCSKCSHVQDIKLADRVFNCQKCGHSLLRDANASINLEKAPIDRVRRASPELTPVDK
ncbi:MAG TPA: transposase [Cyanobacteria bacterium UBA8553]|nr:transposase [Cyanobacteria bacterium UBA8553]HAJ63541.1 transposase [Cyanobacteria bacterium UBA8543]